MTARMLRRAIWNRGVIFGGPAAACYLLAVWCFIIGNMLAGLELIAGMLVMVHLLTWLTDRLAPWVGITMRDLRDFERLGPREWWASPPARAASPP